MKREKRQIILFVDNCPTHPAVNDLKNVKLVFLPLNTTLIIQPMDQGIIWNLKQNYRRLLLQQLLHAHENKSEVTVNVYNAILSLHKSWRLVSTNCIQNCFRKAGFTEDTTPVTSDDDDDNIPLSLLRTTWQEASTTLDFPTDVNFKSYVQVDQDLIIADRLTEDDIIADIIENRTATETDKQTEEDDGFLKPHISNIGYPKPHIPHVGYPKPHIPHVGYPKPHIPHVGYPKPHIPQVGYPKPHIPQVGYPKPHIPQVSSVSQRSFTNTVKESTRKRVIGYIGGSKYHSAMSLLFRSSQAARTSFQRIIKDVVRAEMSAMTHPSFNSVWRSSGSLTDMSELSWPRVLSEAKRVCPTLLSCLTAAITTRAGEKTLSTGRKPKSILPYIGSIIGQLCYQKRKSLSVFPLLVGVQLWLAGCRREVFARMNQLGLSSGIKAVHRCIDGIRDQHKQDVQQWRDLLSKAPGARRQLNFDEDESTRQLALVRAKIEALSLAIETKQPSTLSASMVNLETTPC
ncbi:hypothetical protein ScPMuIL_003602 [Solemya velum]